MAKGRKFAPSTKTDKHWFCARPWTEELDKPRSRSLGNASHPEGLPSKAGEVRQSGFRFSRHDNRNAFQGYGIYFGNGSGKKMIPAKKYQCSTDSFLPSLKTKTPQSCYAASYNKPNTENTRLQHARYPHEHTTRSSHAQRQYNLRTSNILTSFGAPHRTPLHVLAVTQEPFLRANTWVYSHKPKAYNRFLGP